MNTALKQTPPDELDGIEDELEEDQPEDQNEGDEEESGEGDEGQEDEEGEELSITIGDDDEEDEAQLDPEVEAGMGKAALAALNALRKSQKEASRAARTAAREAKVVKAELERVRQEAAPKPVLNYPTIEECGFNDQLHQQRVEEYTQAKAQQKIKDDAEKARLDAVNQDYADRMSKYNSGKTTLKVSDFDEAEDIVVETLSEEQQSMIIRCVEDPAKVIYALGKSKKALSELAKIRDWDRFAYKLAKIEGEIKVNKRTPPPPENRMRSGAPGGTTTGGTLSSRLAAAEKKAEQTGDRSEVIRLKREMKALSQK